MATFLELQNKIALDLSASVNSVLTDEIKDAINDAITHYESDRFEFSEDRTTFPTIALQAEYPKDPTNWPNVLRIDQVQYLFAGHLYQLVRQSYEWYVEAVVNQTAQTGPSNHYAIFEETMFLYPKPDVATTVTISGIHRLTPSPLSADGDTNDWLTGNALQMIRARAKADLYANRLNNGEQAQLQQAVAENYFTELRADADRLQMADTVKPRAYF